MNKIHQHAILLAAIAGMVFTVHAQSDQAQFPTILQQPVDACLPIGATATFSVQAANVTGYQWQFNGNSLDGETNETLTISNLSVANVGYYSVAVINGSEVVPSRSALLNVYTTVSPAVTTVANTAPSLLSATTAKVSSTVAPLALDGTLDMNGGGVIVVFGAPLWSVGGIGNCPGKFSGYVNYTKTVSQGWGWSPATGTTVFTASDTNATNTKIEFVGDYGDSGCAQTTVTIPYPAMSGLYRFSIFFPPGTQVPTNAYPITLTGFNP